MLERRLEHAQKTTRRSGPGKPRQDASRQSRRNRDGTFNGEYSMVDKKYSADLLTKPATLFDASTPPEIIS